MSKKNYLSRKYPKRLSVLFGIDVFSMRLIIMDNLQGNLNLYIISYPFSELKKFLLVMKSTSKIP